MRTPRDIVFDATLSGRCAADAATMARRLRDMPPKRLETVAAIARHIGTMWRLAFEARDRAEQGLAEMRRDAERNAQYRRASLLEVAG